MCRHDPPCPPAHAPDRDAAAVTARRDAQGWALLCNGIVRFDVMSISGTSRCL
ncbi:MULTISPECIES: DUF5999 family protein [Streptomyces]|uniref:DUF5999 family protein n=2 Tax=Streptomyces TaxID=1883 RepID=A0ABV9IIU1_9ACTN